MRPDPAARRQRIVVDAAAGRLDAFLAAHLPGVSRSRVEQLLAAGRIVVNGGVPRKSYRPRSAT
jgi:23S rRNA-/tRNA-specific pseudouridylate synthase